MLFLNRERGIHLLHCAVFIGEKARISGPAQFKPVLLKGQL